MGKSVDFATHINIEKRQKLNKIGIKIVIERQSLSMIFYQHSLFLLIPLRVRLRDYLSKFYNSNRYWTLLLISNDPQYQRCRIFF